jgi:hypothetical protein
MQLITKFSCKLNIERNGTRLLGPKLQNLIYNISVHETNNLFQITISPKSSNLSLPSSPYIPRRFTNKNIHKLSIQCINQGKIGIILLNYCGNVEGYTYKTTPPMLTCIYVSQAEPDTLRHFWLSVQTGPSKRNAIEIQEDREIKRKKPCMSVWNMLNLDVIRLIFMFIGDDIGKYCLVARKWTLMIGEISKKLKFRYPKDVTGEIIVRTIKRNPFLSDINLKDCKNFSYSHLKKAITLPLKHLKSLSVENCRKVTSQALFNMILTSTKLKYLNFLDSGVDNQFFLDLNPTIHLKNLVGLKISSISDTGIQNLVAKYPQLLKIEVHIDILTPNIVYNLLKLENLTDLKLYYDSIEYIRAFKPLAKISVIEILPKVNFTPCNSSFELWDSFTGCNLKHIGCNLPKESLTKLLKYWPELVSARVCEYFSIPSSISILSMYYNDDFDLEIKRNSGEKWMSSLKHFEIIMTRLEYYKIEQISEYFKKYYPLCNLKITGN